MNNIKFIPLFRSLSEEGMEHVGRNTQLLIPLYSFKFSNFHSLQNWKKLEEMELDLMNLLIKLPKYFYIFSHLF